MAGEHPMQPSPTSPGEQLAESGAAGPAEATATGAGGVAKPSRGDSDGGRVKMAGNKNFMVFFLWRFIYDTRYMI